MTNTTTPAAGITDDHLLAWCEGKQSFANRGDAKAVVRWRKRRGTTSRCGALEPYRCPTCGHWHLGQPNLKRRSR